MADPQAELLARLDKEVVDLDAELARFLALVKFCRESVQNEITSGLAYTQQGLPKGTLTQLKDLGTILNSATDCEIRLLKTQKDRANKATKADFLAAARRFVMSLDQGERAEWLYETYKQHKASANPHREQPSFMDEMKPPSE